MYRLLFLVFLTLFLPGQSQAQSTDFSHQIILESKGEYNHSDKHSEEFSALTRLYPILRFGYIEEELTSILQVEGNFNNYNFTDSVRFLFQELYAQFNFREKHHFAFGKKRLNWGTGMLWNPTNFYIQKDPFRTQNRLEGILQASYSLLFANGSLQAYIFPESRLKDFGYALKYDYYGSRADASLSFLRYIGYQQLGMDISYGGDRFTAYAEGVLRYYTDKEHFWAEGVAGFSVIANAHISVRGEYRFHQRNLFAALEWKELYDRWFLQMRTFYEPLSEQLIVSPLFIWKKSNFQVELSTMLFYNANTSFDYQASVLLSCHF